MMKNLYDKLISKKYKLSVIGMDYVGMPIVVAFSEKLKVAGFDINEGKIGSSCLGIDSTKEIGDDKIKGCSLKFTLDDMKL